MMRRCLSLLGLSLCLASAGATEPGPNASNHWAFQPIHRSALPPVKNKTWVRNDLDRFILARLEKEGIAPSPEADRVTLIRRLSLDLIGLPPTLEEIERCAKRYIGGVRTSGWWIGCWRRRTTASAGAGTGSTWPATPTATATRRTPAGRSPGAIATGSSTPSTATCRSTSFTIEQLAGDLLPNATLEQKIATGFHRNTLTNKEGGVDQEQYRVEAVVDRVNTTAKVWLGVTLGCAQCHDHKYDPFAQTEYYQFFAFFNSDAEVNLPAPLPGEEPKLAALKAAHREEAEGIASGHRGIQGEGRQTASQGRQEAGGADEGGGRSSEERTDRHAGADAGTGQTAADARHDPRRFSPQGGRSAARDAWGAADAGSGR